MRLNENIALAKSILRKNNIDENNEDYLKIKEIAGNSFGYIGILTRLRFVDNVNDMEEIKSIFDVLKGSKMDIGKLNKLSYEQILDQFYDDLTKHETEDYELVYKDSTYSFFRVHTYKGILAIGSPAWCLKTKSNWDAYQAKYPEQWVAIDNRWVKNIMTPNNFYLGGQYVNAGKAWVRFGVSIRRNNDNTFSYVAHNDNDGKCVIDPHSHTFYGVLFTILNLSNGHKKSYYQKFLGCRYVKDGVLKIEGDGVWKERLQVTPLKNDAKDSSYLLLSKSYSYVPMVFTIREKSFPSLRVFSTNKNIFKLLPVNPENFVGKALEEYVKEPQNESYMGIRLKLGLTTLDEVKKYKDFLTQVGRWLVFSWNTNNYIVVNSTPTDYTIPTQDIHGNTYWGVPEDQPDVLPMFYFISKKDFKSDFSNNDTREILNQLMGNVTKIEGEVSNIEPKKPGFIKKFFGFK